MDSLNKKKEFYLKQGYYHFKNPSLKLQKICKRAANTIDRLFIDTDGELKTWRSSDGRAKHLINPHLKSKFFLEIIKSPEIKKAISKFLEEHKLQNIYCTHSKISIKEFGEKHEWLLHQDSSYKKMDKPGLTVAVLLDKCCVKNGALEIYPKSHLKGAIRHSICTKGDNKGQTFIEEPINIKPIYVEGNPGEYVIFTSNTIHGGGDNLLGGLRSILIFEVALFKKFAIDTLGNKPIIIKGKNFLPGYYVALFIYKIKTNKLIRSIYKRLRKFFNPI